MGGGKSFSLNELGFSFNFGSFHYDKEVLSNGRPAFSASPAKSRLPRAHVPTRNNEATPLTKKTKIKTMGIGINTNEGRSTVTHIKLATSTDNFHSKDKRFFSG